MDVNISLSASFDELNKSIKQATRSMNELVLFFKGYKIVNHRGRNKLCQVKQ